MPGPAIILVKPQLGENIGKSARAMWNFGLDDLRIVAPRDGWPNPDAVPAAAGADHILENAKLFDTTGEAIADLDLVFAATIRTRDMMKDVVDPEAAAGQIQTANKAGILFGREAAGLSNEDVVLADAVLTVPVNPDFNSLNLAVAVGVIAYECFRGQIKVTKSLDNEGGGRATKAELMGLFAQLEEALEQKGYFHPGGRKTAMKTTIRNLLQAARLNSQQVATLRGVVKALTRE